MKDGVGVRGENGDRGDMGGGLGLRVKMEGGKGVGFAAEDEPRMGLGWSWRWDRETPVRLDLWTRHGIGVRNGNKDGKEVGDGLEISEEMEKGPDGGEGKRTELWVERDGYWRPGWGWT